MSVTTQIVKKFVNDPEDVVPEALAGIAGAHPGLVRVDFDQQLIIRADAPVAGKVGLVSGGGSGHEPLHGGFVGAGMLDAACAGAVFTSPVPDQMQAATKAVDGGAGVLHIVKNYTATCSTSASRRSSPRTTASRWRAWSWTTTAPSRTRSTPPGAAASGATVLAEKIAGARAEAGGTPRPGRGCREDGQRAGTLVRCRAHVLRDTGKGTPIFELGAGRDRGRRRHPRRARTAPREAHQRQRDRRDDAQPDPRRPQARARNVRAGLRERPRRHAADRALPALQRGAEAARSAWREIRRSLVGSYITSLEMAGASVTLLELDDELTSLWDAPVKTAALRWGA